MMNASAKGAQPEVTDAALALLACDLGASCGPNSLLSLQLCAAEGRCEGSARERMLERIGPVDMEAVEAERSGCGRSSTQATRISRPSGATLAERDRRLPVHASCSTLTCR